MIRKTPQTPKTPAQVIRAALAKIERTNAETWWMCNYIQRSSNADLGTTAERIAACKAITDKIEASNMPVSTLGEMYAELYGLRYPARDRTVGSPFHEWRRQWLLALADELEAQQ